MYRLEVLNPVAQLRGDLKSMSINQRPPTLEGKTVGLLWAGSAQADVGGVRGQFLPLPQYFFVQAVPFPDETVAVHPPGDAWGPGRVPQQVVQTGEGGVLSIAGHDALLEGFGDLNRLGGSDEGGAQPGPVGASGQHRCQSAPGGNSSRPAPAPPGSGPAG